MNIADLDKRIKAVCPIHGVSVADPADRRTWRIDFKDNATQGQRTAALVVLRDWDDTTPMQKSALRRVLDRLVAKGVLTAQDVADLQD